MANAKLTLSLEAQVIEKAKSYAAEQGTSVSAMVEKYLKAISGVNLQVEKNESEGADWVTELSTMSKAVPDVNHKEAYGNYITEKYSRS